MTNFATLASFASQFQYPSDHIIWAHSLTLKICIEPQDHIKCINEDRLDLHCVVLTEKKD
jgi:hypothetical protein